MKTLLLPSLLAAGLLFASAAQANADLAKNACGKCHDMDKKKKGPAYKATAAKYKGQADAEDKLLKQITDPNGDHPEIKAKPDEIKAALKWVLQQ